jgi:DNA-binding transcriptional LysR family regulator
MLSRVNLSISPGYTPRLKTTWIRYFLMCSQAGHIAEAARLLGISTQALNRNLNALEHVVGQELIQRQRGSLIMTAAGRHFAAEAQLLLEEIESLSASFGSEPPAAVPIRLGWSHGWEHDVLSEILGQTLDSLAGVFPSIYRYASLSQLEDAVLARELDVGLACRRPRNERLNSLQGPSIPYVIVSAPQPRRHWSLFRYSVLVSPKGRLPHDAEPASWDELRYPRSRSLETDSLSACLEICRQGLAAACLPLNLVEPWLLSRELAIVAEPPEPLYLTPSIFWDGELTELGRIMLKSLLREVS